LSGAPPPSSFGGGAEPRLFLPFPGSPAFDFSLFRLSNFRLFMSFSSDAHLGIPGCASRIFQVRIQKNADVHLRKTTCTCRENYVCMQEEADVHARRPECTSRGNPLAGRKKKPFVY